jgi:hypothetical protein
LITPEYRLLGTLNDVKTSRLGTPCAKKLEMQAARSTANMYKSSGSSEGANLGREGPLLKSVTRLEARNQIFGKDSANFSIRWKRARSQFQQVVIDRLAVVLPGVPFV